VVNEKYERGLRSINMEYMMPIPPTLFAELILLFDYDFSLDSIDRILGLKPTKSERYFATRVNPITKKHNPGYWLIQFEAISSYDIKPLIQIVECFLSQNSSGLNRVIEQCAPSCFILRIHILVQQEDEYPSIRFEPETMQQLSLYNITLDIEVENVSHLR